MKTGPAASIRVLRDSGGEMDLEVVLQHEGGFPFGMLEAVASLAVEAWGRERYLDVSRAGWLGTNHATGATRLQAQAYRPRLGDRGLVVRRTERA